VSGVYVSYPFCNQKCTFCNFASGVSNADTKARYAGRLIEDIRVHAWDWPPESVYLGGGTPSLMPRELLTGVMAAIPSDALGEVTLECAPGTLSPDLVEVWRSCGINRVSLGVQSFVSAELKQTGRRHTATTVLADVEVLRCGGIANINVDLIAGLPGQTRESWEESLDWIERLSPPHASVYIFEVDEDSRLGKEVMQGGVRYGAGILPDEDSTAEFYERAVVRLRSLGIERYEISNFAIPGYESKHNLKYWSLAPYIGFGLDAHSFDGVHRWSTPDSMDAYLRGAKEPPVLAQRSEEHFFIGLRLSSGIEPTHEEWSRFREPIAHWLHSGMLEASGERLKLSERGVLVSNEILQDFVNA